MNNQMLCPLRNLCLLTKKLGAKRGATQYPKFMQQMLGIESHFTTSLDAIYNIS